MKLTYQMRYHHSRIYFIPLPTFYDLLSTNLNNMRTHEQKQQILDRKCKYAWIHLYTLFEINTKKT